MNEQIEASRRKVIRIINQCDKTFEDTDADYYLRGLYLNWHGPDILAHSNLVRDSIWGKGPALVAVLRDGITNEIEAVQKAFIELDDCDELSVCQKINVGFVTGAALQLAPANSVLAIANSFESAMAFWQLTGIATWASCGASNLARIKIPSNVEKLVIVGDNDTKSREIAFNAAEAYTEQGIITEIHFPAVIKDQNKEYIESQNWSCHLAYVVSAEPQFDEFYQPLGMRF